MISNFYILFCLFVCLVVRFCLFACLYFLLLFFFRYHAKPLRLLEKVVVPLFLSYVANKTSEQTNEENQNDEQMNEEDKNNEEETGGKKSKPKKNKTNNNNTNVPEGSESYATLTDYSIPVYFKVCVCCLLLLFLSLHFS
jgi:hypothetical protein